MSWDILKTHTWEPFLMPQPLLYHIDHKTDLCQFSYDHHVWDSSAQVEGARALGVR